VVVMIMMT